MANSVNIKLFGPWVQVDNLLKQLAPNLRTIAISAQRKIAEKYVRKVKAHLKNQDIPGWTPLSDRYADYKMGKYGNEDMLIATWDYYDSIKAWRSGGVYHAGVPKGVTYPNGNEISRIAEIHETWSSISGKPKRPLWGYTLKKDMGGLKGIKKDINEIVVEKLRAKGYPINSFRF